MIIVSGHWSSFFSLPSHTQTHTRSHVAERQILWKSIISFTCTLNWIPFLSLSLTLPFATREKKHFIVLRWVLMWSHHHECVHKSVINFPCLSEIAWTHTVSANINKFRIWKIRASFGSVDMDLPFITLHKCINLAKFDAFNDIKLSHFDHARHVQWR